MMRIASPLNSEAMQLLLTQVPDHIMKNTSVVEISQFHLQMQPNHIMSNLQRDL